MLASGKAFKHLIILRILASDADFAFYSSRAVTIDYVDPFATRLLEKRATRNEQGGFGRTELKVEVVGLT